MVKMNYLELIGYFAGACTTISFVPQVYKIIKTKSVKDISVSMYIIFIAGICGWLTYGIISSSSSMIAANSFTLFLSIIILSLRLLWGDRKS
jgi:MtN3 and saliva related transmembrane protein